MGPRGAAGLLTFHAVAGMPFYLCRAARRFGAASIGRYKGSAFSPTTIANTPTSVCVMRFKLHPVGKDHAPETLVLVSQSGRKPSQQSGGNNRIPRKLSQSRAPRHSRLRSLPSGCSSLPRAGSQSRRRRNTSRCEHPENGKPLRLLFRKPRGRGNVTETLEKRFPLRRGVQRSQGLMTETFAFLKSCTLRETTARL